MSGQTKNQIRQDRDSLLGNLNKVTDENETVRMENEELVLKLDDLQAKFQVCEERLENAMQHIKEIEKTVAENLGALIHVKRQRDTLIGYIEGTREDRERANMIVPDHRGEPIERTRTDDFLDSMRIEPGGGGTPGDRPRRAWEFP